jgi:hypothetical protein
MGAPNKWIAKELGLFQYVAIQVQANVMFAYLPLFCFFYMFYIVLCSPLVKLSYCITE